MTAIPKHDLTTVVLLSNMRADVDQSSVSDDLFPIISDWITSLSGSGDLSMVAFDPNTLTRRRDAATNTTLFGIRKPEVTVNPDWKYKPTGSTAHIDAAIRGTI